MRRLLLITAIAALLLNVACKSPGSSNANNMNTTSASPVPTAPANRSDAWIVTHTKLQLLADSATSGFDIAVAAKDGAVTLSGKVDTEAAKTAAEDTVTKGVGISRVDNQLQVAADAKRKDASLSDDKIKNAIGELIDHDAKLNELSLSVDSTAGVVSVDGSVDTGEQLLYAAQSLRKLPGVKSVVTSRVTVNEEKQP
jgi:osmotically-inducible protein OsmY